MVKPPTGAEAGLWGFGHEVGHGVNSGGFNRILFGSGAIVSIQSRESISSGSFLWTEHHLNQCDY